MSDFAMGSVKGVRTWRLHRQHDGPYLTATSMAYTWHKGVNHAAHDGSGIFDNYPVADSHHVAGMGCTCGFYAFYRDTPERRFGQTDGVIEGWGRVTLGTKGFRCQHAKIVALVAPSQIVDLSRESLVTKWAMRMERQAMQDDGLEALTGAAAIAVGVVGGFFSIGLWQISLWFALMSVAFGLLAAWGALWMKALWRAMEIYRWDSIHPEWAHLRPPTGDFLSREEAERLYPGVHCYDSREQMLEAEEVDTLSSVPRLDSYAKDF